MSKELDSEFIILQSKQAQTISNIAELVSESAKIYANSLKEYTEFTDKYKGSLYVDMCSNNLSGSIYQFNCAVEMLNCNLQPTWNIIREQVENDDISIKFGTTSDETTSINSDDIVSDEIVSDDIVSDEIVSDEIVSDEIVSDEIVSDDIISDEIVSDEIVSDDIISDEIVSDEIVPSEIKSIEIISSEIKSIEIISSEIVPSEIESSEIVPSEIVPSEIESSEIVPSEIKSIEIISSEIVPSEIISDDIVSPDTYSLPSTTDPKKIMLESSSYISKKYINPNEVDRNIFIVRNVDIDKLIQFHDGIEFEYQSTRNFWNWCWYEHKTTFKWNLEEGTIYINAPSKKSLNDCLYKLAIIFENI